MTEPEFPVSTPTSRWEWAVAYARDKARVGENVTVRNLQDSVKAHFGKKMGQDRARQIVKDANATVTPPQPAVFRNRNWPGLEGLAASAVRLIQDERWAVTSIKMNDDGTMTVILAPTK